MWALGLPRGVRTLESPARPVAAADAGASDDATAVRGSSRRRPPLDEPTAGEQVRLVTRDDAGSADRTEVSLDELAGEGASVVVAGLDVQTAARALRWGENHGVAVVALVPPAEPIGDARVRLRAGRAARAGDRRARSRGARARDRAGRPRGRRERGGGAPGAGRTRRRAHAAAPGVVRHRRRRAPAIRASRVAQWEHEQDARVARERVADVRARRRGRALGGARARARRADARGGGAAGARPRAARRERVGGRRPRERARGTRATTSCAGSRRPSGR